MVSVVDIRKRGIKAVEDELQKENKAIISFKGRPKYVMLTLEEYERLLLDSAYNELKKKKKQGKAFVSGAKELIERIENEL